MSVRLSLLFILFLTQSLAAQDKVPLWRRAIGGVIQGNPSAQALSVVMIVEGGMVKAYSPQGNLLWEYLANGKLLPFTTRTGEGRSYICRTNGVLIALNRTGLELWKVDIKTPLSHAVIIGWDGRIFAPMDNKIACYNDAGRLLWTKEFDGSIALTPVLDKNGGLLTVLDNGKLLQISAFSKIEEMPLAQTPSLISSLFPNEDNASTDGILVIGGDGDIEVIGGKGQFPHLEASPLAVREYDGKTAIALSNGEVLLFSNAGEKIWSADSGVSGARVGETVLLHDERGVYVLGMTKAAGFDFNGTVKWSIDIKNAAVSPSFGDEGVLYLSGNDWILYAYRMEDTPRDETWRNTAPLKKYGLGELPRQKADYYQFNDFSLGFQFDIIREKMIKGILGEDEPSFTVFLKEAAASMRNSLSIPASKPPVYLSRRIEAVKLLELFGSEELVPFFADIFLGDREPLVKIAAASAIASIGVDHEGAAMAAFAKAGVDAADERVLSSVAKAVGALCRQAGPLAMGKGVPLLAAIGARADAPLAQKQALKELKSLQR